jgi:hypothetical protein
MRELDEIDKKILETVEEKSGSQVKDIIVALDRIRSDGVIRARMNALEIRGCILQDRRAQRGKVFAVITRQGREFLAERRTAAQTRGPVQA